MMNTVYSVIEYACNDGTTTKFFTFLLDFPPFCGILPNVRKITTNMHIDIKCTTWEQIILEDDSNENKVITFLKENPKAESSDLISFLDENSIGYVQVPLDGLSPEVMTVDENSGRATIELNDLNKDGKTAFDNVSGWKS